MTHTELNEIEEAARLDGNYRAKQLVGVVRGYKALLRDNLEELRWLLAAMAHVDWAWDRASGSLCKLIEAAEDGDITSAAEGAGEV